MDKISAMHIFRRVSESGSFSAVSREMGLSQPTVSKQIAALEENLSTKLLSRSTRQINLTDAGRHYYGRCCQILDEIAETEAELSNQRTLPTGMLRVNIPIAAGRIKILPCLWEFIKTYPELKVDTLFDDNYIDLVKEGVDVAIRIGELSDSSLVAKKIGMVPRYMVASSTYLKLHGEPKTLKDLEQHNCIVYNLLNTRNEWHFDGVHGKQKISVQGQFSSNSPDAIRQAVLENQGIAVILGWIVEDDIKQGNMEVIMPDYVPTALEVNAMYPQRRFMPAKVSLLLDYLQKKLL